MCLMKYSGIFVGYYGGSYVDSWVGREDRDYLGMVIGHNPPPETHLKAQKPTFKPEYPGLKGQNSKMHMHMGLKAQCFEGFRAS